MAELIELDEARTVRKDDDSDLPGSVLAYGGQLEAFRGKVYYLTARLHGSHPDLSEEITRGFDLAERVYRAIRTEVVADDFFEDANLRSLLEQLFGDLRAVCQLAEDLLARTGG